MTAAFFSAGLGLGFTLGLLIGLACWFLATKAAESKYKTKIAQLTQSQAVQRTALEQKVKELISANGNGTNLSERHRQVLSEELSGVLRARK